MDTGQRVPRGDHDNKISALLISTSGVQFVLKAGCHEDLVFSSHTACGSARCRSDKQRTCKRSDHKLSVLGSEDALCNDSSNTARYKLRPDTDLCPVFYTFQGCEKSSCSLEKASVRVFDWPYQKHQPRTFRIWLLLRVASSRCLRHYQPTSCDNHRLPRGH